VTGYDILYSFNCFNASQLSSGSCLAGPLISIRFYFYIYISANTASQQHGAAEARRAHNPEVPGSKPGAASCFLLIFFFACRQGLYADRKEGSNFSVVENRTKIAQFAIAPKPQLSLWPIGNPGVLDQHDMIPDWNFTSRVTQCIAMT
jgi:hypothetical protein